MRLVVANIYVGNKHIEADIDRLDRINPLAVFCCEAARWHDELEGLGRLFIGHSTKARRNTGVLLTRDNIEVLDSRIEFLSEDTGYDVGKERWAYVVRCLIDGIPTSLIAIHLTAGLARTKNMHANRRGLVKISAIVEREREEGFTPIVGGDHNDRGKVRPDLTPQEAYDRLGLTYIWHRNDGIAYDRKVWQRVDFRTVTPKGSDHDFVILDLKPRSTKTVLDAHQSGHHEATSSEWDTMLSGAAEKATLLGLTEAKRVPPISGWAKHSGSDESEVMWDRSVWEALDQGEAHIDTPRWERGSRTMESLPVTWVLLRHKETGLVVLRAVAHFPAHLHRLAQRKAHAAALAGLGPVLNRLAERLGPDEIVFSADFNLHLGLKRNRERISAAAQGLRLVVPTKPTFRNDRIIDGHLTTMRPAGRDMLPRWRGFDHRGARVALTLDRPAGPDPEEEEPMHGFMPGAIHKPIPAGDNDPSIQPVGVVYHVAVSLSDSLHDFFAHQSGGIESHFYIRHDGTIEQYRSIFREADANYHGNSFGSPRKGFLSIETEGMGDGEWTEAQIASLKRVTLWCASEGDFPIRRATGPFGTGIGYHVMWGAPSEWTPHVKSCPGAHRIRQFDTIFVPWFNAGAPHPEEDDMPSPDDLWNHPVPDYSTDDKKDTSRAQVILAQTHNRALDARRAAHAAANAAKSCEAAVKALAKALGPEVEAAVEDALKNAVVEVDVDVAQGVEEG